ncbi:26561_t:CDS:1, partial [Dentiscutata erythropus]
HDAVLLVKTVVVTFSTEPTTKAETQDYLFQRIKSILGNLEKA